MSLYFPNTLEVVLTYPVLVSKSNTVRNTKFAFFFIQDTPGGTAVLQVSIKDEDGDIVIYSISGIFSLLALFTITRDKNKRCIAIL